MSGGDAVPGNNVRGAARRVRPYALAIIGGWLGLASSQAANTFIWAVQLSAAVDEDTPAITLNWENNDPYGPTNFTVYRKGKNDPAWGDPIATLPGSAASFTDDNVSLGVGYEYQVVKQDAAGYVGYGYIYSGIDVPLTDNRGTLVLLVETNATVNLTNELAQLQTDLVGDGWRVHSYGVSSNDTPDSVRGIILNEYDADPADVNAVFLLGHVPVLESGDLNYDGHEARPMPADAFYGDVADDWPTDIPPDQRPGYLPSDVQFMIGRVDFFGMTGAGASVPWPDEAGLLQRYLNKDHNWRTKQIDVQRRALMGDSRGGADGYLATAASGYRTFDPMVGPGNTDEANADYGAPPEERWISLPTANSYLWAYGNGGGAPYGISGLGTDSLAGTDSFMLSTDVVGLDAHVVFVMLFASWFGEWDLPDDLMRSFLATPTMGLACVESGEPHWFFHHMGLGEPIGYSARLTMSNSSLYQNQENDFTRAVYIALMGDPTLRLEPVAPPANLSASATPNGVVLNWSPSSDEVVGYNIYRASTPAGPFLNLTPSPVEETTFTDGNTDGSTYTYMVRAILLQNNFSGSYYNPSEGIFVTLTSGTTVVVPTPKIWLSLDTNGLVLTWNTVPGASYHVEVSADLSSDNWVPDGQPLTATGTFLTWNDWSFIFLPQLFYRVVSP